MSHSSITFFVKGLIAGNCSCLLCGKFKLAVPYQIEKGVLQRERKEKKKKKKEPNFLLLSTMVANVAIISSAKDRVLDLSINSVSCPQLDF